MQAGSLFAVIPLTNGNDGAIQSADRPEFAAGKLKSKDLRDLLESQGYCCALTGRPLTPQVAQLDHVQPISKGGKNVKTNAQILHAQVNQAKGTMSQDEFIEMCREVVRWVDGG